MCCIFTCCGWMIDLIQRLWTFTMSCCISSAVCCALVTASMAGIALGYNYSLAEYIDLKETNVSVYLKRGVFDDEMADDMDWRRSGHMPVQGHLKDSNLVTGGVEGPEEMPLRSGRRLDDSLMISDDQHKFEGSLMRLTAKPPEARSEPSPEPVTSDSQMAEIMNKYPMGSLEQMKAIHGLMNMRRLANQRNTVLPPTLSGEGYDISGRRRMPVNRNNMLPIDYGPINSEAYKKFNPARFKVPDESIREPANWFLPKNQVPDSYKRTMDMLDYDNVPPSQITLPQPIRITTEIERPTIPKLQRPTQTHIAKPKDILGDQDSAISRPNFEKFKNKLLMEGMDLPRFNNDPFKEPISGKEFKSEDEYEDEANKGLPIRRKRTKRNIVNEGSYSSYNQTIYTKYTSIYASSTNYHDKNLSEVNGRNTTRSILISTLKSLSNTRHINDSSTSKLNVSSIIPSPAEKSLKMISRFVYLQ